MKRARKGRSRMEEMVKDVNERMLKKGMIWRKKDGWNIFEELLNVEEDREVVVIMVVGDVQVPVMRERERDYKRESEEGIEWNEIW